VLKSNSTAELAWVQIIGAVDACGFFEGFAGVTFGHWFSFHVGASFLNSWVTGPNYNKGSN